MTKNKEEINSFKRVVINGVTDDPKAFKYFNWLDESSLFGGAHRGETKKISRDSLYMSLDSLSQPNVMEVIAFGDSLNYVHRVFVTPGDSILFKIENKKVRFIGKNASHYNFFIEMDSLGFKDPYYNGDINDYKKECKTIFIKQKEFYDQYLKKHSKCFEGF
ncbi:hypothetical protein [Flavivirga rizhaonensis]|uniref:Uncharacterized protein n=1 Tax=Flavivirga rizhaonensis TaxID=2559571 RepID=A0A4S1DSY5_9FLAO|nr:hypothetical protein [Flavivirga rizhaonensis]TGV00873.1 hypothetical protein EM932_17780 [Flavivirga rizhaonensis]